ncbi:hypothetical protein ACVIHF_000881 [Bradyrhizobium sp. USDA 4506]
MRKRCGAKGWRLLKPGTPAVRAPHPGTLARDCADAIGMSIKNCLLRINASKTWVSDTARRHVNDHIESKSCVQIDPADLLPDEGARQRFDAIVDRAANARSTWVPLDEEMRATRGELHRVETRRKRLILARTAGDPGADKEDAQIRDLDVQAAGLAEKLRCLIGREATAAARMRRCGSLASRCRAFLVRGSLPSGMRLASVSQIALSEILKRDEPISEALKRLRLRLGELDAEEHRIRSAPFPSEAKKRDAAALIARLAERGAPSITAMIDDNASEIKWPVTLQEHHLMAAVLDAGTRVVGRASGQVPDVIGLICWVLRDTLTEKVNELIDTNSDDAAAVPADEREKQLAKIEADKLMIERKEAALVQAAQDAGEAIEHRTDISVLAALQLELVTPAL